MTDHVGPADLSPEGGPDQQARFTWSPAAGREPVTVHAAGDIDLINVGQFESVLAAATAASAVTVDLTAVTYCDSAAIRALFGAARQAALTIRVSAAGPVTETLLKVSGLDQVTTVETLD